MGRRRKRSVEKRVPRTSGTLQPAAPGPACGDRDVGDGAAGDRAAGDGATGDGVKSSLRK